MQSAIFAADLAGSFMHRAYVPCIDAAGPRSADERRSDAVTD